MAFSLEMEPMLPAEARLADSELPDLSIELERKATALAGEARPMTAEVLESHMRVLHAYYSNLIEGNRPWRKMVFRRTFRNCYYLMLAPSLFL